LRDVSNIAVKDFSNLINSCILSIFLPEWLFNMRNSINANTVKVKFLNGIFNPVKKSLSYPLVILVKIWKICKAAVLNLVLVVPVDNLAFRVIVRRIIERINFVVISINISYMIGDYIKHHPNSHGLSCLDHVLEVLLVSKIWVDFVPIKRCVPMIVIAIVFRNR
jgi:hypothetical protein